MAFPPLDVLLVEPWLAGSHRAWAEGLRWHSRHRVELLAQEPGSWKSTMERSARELAARVGSTPDLVLASGMMDVAEFRILSGLQNVPTLLYLHENQLTYHRAKPDLARGGVNWRSVEVADLVAFNSRFHLEDFFEALPALGPAGSRLDDARRKSLVLPVGIDLAIIDQSPRREDGPPVVLWNHRWEADKQPETFVNAVLEVADVPFRLILAGGGTGAGRLTARLVDHFGDRVLHAGFAPAGLYPTLLNRADVVVSTARQEFFGLSIAEAMASGAVPLVPNRLAYPELLGPQLAECLYEPGTLASRLRSVLTNPGLLASLRPEAVTAGRRFDWRQIAPHYDEVIDSMT